MLEIKQTSLESITRRYLYKEDILRKYNKLLNQIG